jgi:diaminopimelate decarboxylase
MNKEQLFGNPYVNIFNNELIIDKIPVNLIASQYGTPTFIFISNKIRDNLRKIKRIFQNIFPNSMGFYSTKANYLQAILNIVNQEGFGAEIISSTELHLVKQSQFPIDRILTGGPYLPDNFMQEIIETGLKYFVCYDLEDLPRIQKALTLYPRKKIHVIFRFTTPKFTGRQGIPFLSDCIEKIAKTLLDCPQLEFEGILSHLGTQLNTDEDYLHNLEFLMEIAGKLETQFGLTSHVFDIGGGFPNADALKEDRLLNILSKVKDSMSRKGWDRAQIFYEPGRFIVGDTGFCLGRILKYDSISRTAFLDIGNQFIPKFMKTAIRFYDIDKITEHPNYPIDFMGPMPSDQDILLKNYNFPPHVATGDRVLIANVGAYALTFSTRFPYPFPLILIINGDQINVLHHREDGDVFLS